MTGQHIEASITGGQIQGVAGAGSVVIENFTIYNRAVEEKPSGDAGAKPIPPCPYPGLAYFGPGDADRFFGRGAAIARLAKAVGRQSFTALVGASGSGKSSVVLAGLAPHLHGAGGWRFSHFRIGTELERNPFLALARALVPLFVASDSDTERLRNTRQLAASLESGELTLIDVFADCRNRNKGSRILLIADQFEEAFTLVEDEAVRHRFIDVLLDGFRDPAAGSAPDICLIVTLRADFYGRALRHRPLADALQGHVENLGPMTRDELRTAILRPAETAGVSFEPGLVETLLDEVETRPGGLPLLQFALREMWGRQERGQITRQCYDDIGGVEGALSQRAQTIFASLTDNGTNTKMEENFRRLFTRLVTLGEGQEDTRRVVGRGELGDELWSLAQRLAGEDNRLVVTSAPAFSRETAEVVHEALIRHWPELVAWINRDRAFHTWLRQIRSNIELWAADPGDEGALLRGGMLAQARDWLARRRDDLGVTERSFIEASIALNRREEEEKEAARQAEISRQQELAAASAMLATEQRRRAKTAVVGAIAALLLAFIAGYWALESNRNAHMAAEATRVAMANEERANSAAEEALQTARVAADNAFGALAALSTIAGGVKSAKLALAAWPRTASSDGVQLRDVIRNLSRAALQLRGSVRGSYEAVGLFSPDGKRFAIQIVDEIVLRDVETGLTSAPHPAYINRSGFAFSPDGTRFASSSQEDVAWLWGATADEKPIELPADSGGVTSVGFSSDGSFLVTGTTLGEITLWDPGDPTRPIDRFHLDEHIWDLAVSPDGGMIASSSRDGDVTILSTRAPGEIVRLAVYFDHSRLTFSPNGDLIAMVRSGVLRLLDLQTHEERLGDSGMEIGSPTAFAFSPDGASVAVGGPGGLVRILNVATGSEAGPDDHVALAGHSGAVTSIAVSRDGARLLTGGIDGTVRLWSLADGIEIARFDGHAATIAAVAFAEEDERIAVGYGDGTARTFALAEATVLWHRVGEADSERVTMSHDGTRVAVETVDLTARIYDTASGAQIETLVLPKEGLTAFALLPDRKLIATGKWRTVEVWDVSKPSSNPVFQAEVNSASGPLLFSRDGTRLAVGGGSRGWGVAYVWDVATGQPLLEFDERGPGAIDLIAFSHDGSRAMLRHTMGWARWHNLSGASEALEPSDVPGSVVGWPVDEWPLDDTARTIAFSADGARVVGAEGDVIYLWDLMTGAKIARFSGHGVPISQIVFAPEPGRVVSLSEDGTVGSWDISTVPDGNLFQVVCALLPNHDLDDVLADYPITIDEPICNEGYDPPLPEWRTTGAHKLEQPPSTLR